MNVFDFHHAFKEKIEESLKSMPTLNTPDAIRRVDLQKDPNGYVLKGMIGPFDIGPKLSDPLTQKDKETVSSYSIKHDCTLAVLSNLIENTLKGHEYAFERKLYYYQNGYIGIGFHVAVFGKKIKGMEGEYIVLTSGSDRFGEKFVLVDESNGEVVSMFNDFEKSMEVIETLGYTDGFQKVLN